MFHVFPILMPWAEASRRVYRAVGEFVDRRPDDRAPGPRPVRIPPDEERGRDPDRIDDPSYTEAVDDTTDRWVRDSRWRSAR